MNIHGKNGGTVISFGDAKKRKEQNQPGAINKEEVEKARAFILEAHKKHSNIVGRDLITMTDALKGIEKFKIEKGETLIPVFQTYDDASFFASLLLERPEYSDISHFEITICTSRASVFFKLVPVLATEAKFVFHNDVLEAMAGESLKRMSDETVLHIKQMIDEMGYERFTQGPDGSYEE